MCRSFVTVTIDKNRVDMMRVFLLSGIMPSGIMLNVVAPIICKETAIDERLLLQSVALKIRDMWT
jgi:hypothetical protein